MNNSLTSIRFFAFFSVFLFHQLVFPIGYLGVQAFFVLSGFLLTVILVEAKENKTGKHYFLSFYGRRVLRIFPVYYAYLGLVFCLAAPFYFPGMKSDIPVINRFYQQLPWAFTYTYNFFHASDTFKHTYLLTHFWSLAIEEQFYLLWPLVIYLTPRHRLKACLLAIIFLGPLWRWLTGELVKAHTLSWLGHDPGLVVYVLPFSHFDAFAAGGFFALYGRACSVKTLSGYLAAVLLLGVGISAILEPRIDWWGLGYSNFMGESYKYVWGYTLFNLYFAGLLVNLRDRQRNNAWLGASWLVYLGSISYGLYVFHNAFIWLAASLLPAQATGLRLLGVFLMTLLLSALSYRYLEQPCLNLKDRFFPSGSRRKPSL